MFESPKNTPSKPSDEMSKNGGPADPNRRRMMGALVGAVAIGTIGETVSDAEAQPSVSSIVSSESYKKIESTRPILMDQLARELGGKNRELYLATLQYLSGLQSEKSTLLGRQSSIISELKGIGKSNPNHLCLLLENNRINLSLNELNSLIQEIGTIITKSPFHNVPSVTLPNETKDGYIEKEDLPDTVKKRKLTM